MSLFVKSEVTYFSCITSGEKHNKNFNLLLLRSRVQWFLLPYYELKALHDVLHMGCHLVAVCVEHVRHCLECVSVPEELLLHELLVEVHLEHRNGYRPILPHLLHYLLFDVHCFWFRCLVPLYGNVSQLLEQCISVVLHMPCVSNAVEELQCTVSVINHAVLCSGRKNTKTINLSISGKIPKSANSQKWKKKEEIKHVYS